MTGGQHFIFAATDARSLWNFDDVEIISASFNATQNTPTGDYYSNQATVELAAVLTDDTALIYPDLYSATVLANLGTFSFDATAAIERDITPWFLDDYDSGFLNIVFRLAFGSEPPSGIRKLQLRQREASD